MSHVFVTLAILSWPITAYMFYVSQYKGGMFLLAANIIQMFFAGCMIVETKQDHK